MKLSIELEYEISAPGSDFIFNIHAARTARQRVVDEALMLSQDVPSTLATDPVTLNRRLCRAAAWPGCLASEPVVPAASTGRSGTAGNPPAQAVSRPWASAQAEREGETPAAG
jgi:hypothetical protein